MVLEHDKSLQKVFRNLLIRSGYGVLTARTPTEAVALATSRKFDFLLLDLDLPDTVSEKLFFTLRDLCPNLPMLIVVNNAEGDRLDRILQTEPLTLLKKPIDANSLSKAFIAVKCAGEDISEGVSHRGVQTILLL